MKRGNDDDNGSSSGGGELNRVKKDEESGSVKFAILKIIYVIVKLVILSKVELVKIAPPFQLVEKNY